MTRDDLHSQITSCRRCDRLVEWREKVAREKVRRFAHEDYWGRPVPGFGDRSARLWIVGLAPAAHGANRTGRMFTGDRSGDWLYRALHRAGFANQGTSQSRDDGLELRNCFVSSVVRCAPPGNKPLPTEITSCRPFLARDCELLPNVRVVLALGKIGFDNAFSLYKDRLGLDCARPLFGHAVECPLPGGLLLLGCFHPSQQNTFTGKLTEEMLDSVIARARALAEETR